MTNTSRIKKILNDLGNFDSVISPVAFHDSPPRGKVLTVVSKAQEQV